MDKHRYLGLSYSPQTEGDFAEFAKGRDEAEIRAAFEAHHFMGDAARAAHTWLLRRERQSGEATAALDREERLRAVAAAERSARWALIAAVASGVSAVAAAVAVVLQWALRA